MSTRNFQEAPHGHENSTPLNEDCAWVKPSEIQNLSTEMGRFIDSCVCVCVRVRPFFPCLFPPFARPGLASAAAWAELRRRRHSRLLCYHPFSPPSRSTANSLRQRLLGGPLSSKKCVHARVCDASVTLTVLPEATHLSVLDAFACLAPCFIGTFTFTGWSLIGKAWSDIISIKVCAKQSHTNKAPTIVKSRCVNQIHTNKAPTNKCKSPHECYLLWIVVC